MFKIRILTFTALTIILSFSVMQPAKATRRAATVFTSVYTDLNRDCKSALTKKEEKEAEARGTDIPLRCKGYGGYYVEISYSAMASNISISMKGSDDSISLGMFPLNYDAEKGRKIEWRMADGKPFAVIMRSPEYSDTATGADVFDPKNKTGESLIIKGLKGYDYIETQIDAKTPNANAKAREIADAAFTKGRAD